MTPPESHAGFSVVIADDDELVVEALSGLIEDHPGLWLVGACADGQQAADLCAAHTPDLVVLDVAMPLGGADGLQAVRASSPASTVVFYTAQGDRRTRQRLTDAGAAAVFAKGAPIDLAGELHALVAAASDARSQEGSATVRGPHAARPATGEYESSPDDIR